MLSARRVDVPGPTGSDATGRGGRPVKKFLAVGAVAAIAGFLVWKKAQADKLEQDLWTEATQETADLR